MNVDVTIHSWSETSRVIRCARYIDAHGATAPTDESEAVLPAAALLASALAMTVRLVQVGRPHLEPLPADVSETAYLSSAAARVRSIERELVDYDVLHGDHPRTTSPSTFTPTPRSGC